MNNFMKKYEDLTKIKKSIYLIHYGTSDILVSIGIIKYYCKNYDENILLMPIENENIKSLCDFIFKDISNLNINYYPTLSHIDLKEALKIISKYEGYTQNFIGKIWDKLRDIKKFNNNLNHISYHQFYDKYFVNNNEIVNSFKIKRDIDLEDKTYTNFIKKYGKQYILLHENHTFSNMEFYTGDKESLKIKKSYLNFKNVPCVDLNGISDCMFDMIKVMQNAKEIHLTPSSWLMLIYLLQVKYKLFNNNIYIHKYTKNNIPNNEVITLIHAEKLKTYYIKNCNNFYFI